MIKKNQVFESSRISFVEVSELLVNDYLDMVNDYENVNGFIGGEHKTYTVEQERKRVQKKLEEKRQCPSSGQKKTPGRFRASIKSEDMARTAFPMPHAP